MSDMTVASEKQWFGHPRGLATLFFTEMWERFSYYGMRALLPLYLVAPGGLGLGPATATAIYSVYVSLVYLLALPGGWFSYEMAVDPAQPMALVATYWSDDHGRELEIQIDGKPFATAKPDDKRRATFFDAAYAIPPELTKGKKTVTVRLAASARERPEDLARLPIPIPGRPELVPLAQLAQLRESLAPAQIEHLDGERVITVGANAEGQPLSAVNAGIDRALAGLDVPAGYERKAGGETEDQQEVFGRIFTSLGIAILLMYFVLVVQFGSFLDPIPIMLSLPLSLIGVMLAMLVTGATLNLMSMIGVILLMGLVAKNAILLIDFAKRAQRGDRNREEALVEAGAVRFRPIIMTSVAVIAGMLPVALGRGEGGDFRAPLGLAVIGGVVTSTILTLLVIPTFYDIVANGRDRLLARIRRRRRHHADASSGDRT